MNNQDYVFIIYSCKRNLNKAKILYNILSNQINMGHVYICVGDPNIKQSLLGSTILTLKCPDTYESLSDKTIELFSFLSKEFPNLKGVIKCDDDIYPNKKFINNLIHSCVRDNKDYAGFYIQNYEKYFLFNGSSDKSKNGIYKKEQGIWYCGGPIYYLSKKAIDLFNTHYVYHIAEDYMVGHTLYKHKLNIGKFDIYTDKYDIYSSNFHNNKEKLKYIILILKGSFGEQLFQISSILYISAIYKLLPLIVYSNELHLINDKINTIYKNLNTITTAQLSLIDKEKITYINFSLEQQLSYQSLIKLDKPSNIFDQHQLFDYSFKNLDYFNNIRKMLYFIYNVNKPIISNIYKKINNKYFIYIRDQTSINNTIFNIDYYKYLKHSIEYICKHDSEAKYYIIYEKYNEDHKINDILSNVDYENITTLTDIEQLYFMNSCKGGICNNDELSWWGGYLNRNNNIIILPKQYFNCEMDYNLYYNNAIVL